MCSSFKLSFNNVIMYILHAIVCLSVLSFVFVNVYVSSTVAVGTTLESDKNIVKHQIQEVSPFPAGDHKAAMNRQKSMTNTKQKWYTKEASSWNGQ